MNLEPVFNSGEIEKTLPVETSKFRDVDRLWRDTTEQINDEPGIMELTERENLLSAFTEANKKLDDIQRSLNQYLEIKSNVFPRFFFLASDDLLMLLAQTKDPRAVQPHMDKCFEGI
jgi:dynein heavy chain